MQANPNSQFHVDVCDDEPLDRQNIVELTGKLLSAENVAHGITQYSTGPELLSAVSAGVKSHLLQPGNGYAGI